MGFPIFLKIDHIVMFYRVNVNGVTCMYGVMVNGSCEWSVCML